MPKAIQITPNNKDLIVELSGWEEDAECVGYFFVTDIQFPHGYVDQAIITPSVYMAMFKSDSVVGSDRLYDVDYK